MSSSSYYQIYRDIQNQWRWRFVASNGRVIGVSSEAYWNLADCRAAVAIMQSSGSAPVYEP